MSDPESLDTDEYEDSSEGPSIESGANYMSGSDATMVWGWAN